MEARVMIWSQGTALLEGDALVWRPASRSPAAQTEKTVRGALRAGAHFHSSPDRMESGGAVMETVVRWCPPISHRTALINPDAPRPSPPRSSRPSCRHSKRGQKCRAAEEPTEESGFIRLHGDSSLMGWSFTSGNKDQRGCDISAAG